VNRLRHRLIAAFLAATILPFGATVWITRSLLDRSLGYATTGELDRLSKTFETTVRHVYQRERDRLKEDAGGGRVPSIDYRLADRDGWPERVRAFWDGGEAERFAVSDATGETLSYLRRDRDGVRQFSRSLPLPLETLSGELRRTRELVNRAESRDLRRGFTLTLLILVAAVWAISLAPLFVIAHRVSRPIQQLTAGLTDSAATAPPCG
jgi:hypothetical protein